MPSSDSKADAVDRDGAFRHDVARKIFGNFHAKPPIVACGAFGIEARHAACAVNMALNKVASEFFADGERLLEINAGAFFQCAVFRAERCFLNGLAGKIGGESFFPESDDCQAAAVHRDAIGNSERRDDAGSVYRDAPAAGLHAESFDCAEMLDDSCEHNFPWIPRKLLRNEFTAFRRASRKHYTTAEQVTDSFEVAL